MPALGFRKLWPYLALALLLLVAFSSIAPPSQLVPDTDSSVFFYIGQRILQGDVPYRDVWDHKGPLIFYIDALGQFLSPHSPWGVWFLELALVSLAVFLLFALSKSRFGLWPALFGSVLFVLQLPHVLDGGNLTEEFVLPFQMLCIWLSFDDGRAKNRTRLLLAGLAAAACFWLRPNLIGVPLAVGLTLLLRGRATWFILGGLLGLAPPVLYFMSQDALRPMWSALLRFNFVYGTSEGNAWGALWAGYYNLPLLMLFGLAGWVCSVPLLANKPRLEAKTAYLLLVACLALPIEIGLTLFSGRAFPHYYMAWLPALAILASAFIYFLKLYLAPSNQRIAARFSLSRLLVLALLLGFLPAAIASQWPSVASAARSLSARGFTAPDLSQHRYAEVLAYLADHVEPDQPLLVLGNQVTLNWLSGRPSPTRFVYQTPLFTDGYTTPAMIDEVIAELQENPPVVIDTGPPGGFLPSLGTRVGKLPDLVRPLYHYLQEHYIYAGTFEQTGWDLYLYFGQGEKLNSSQ